MLTVTRIDRLGRNAVQLVTLLDDLHKRGIEFKSIEQDVDTRTIAGKIFFFVMALVAENERINRRDSVIGGMQRAMDKGVKFGPKFKLSNEQMEQLVKLHRLGTSWRELQETFGISKGTVKAYIDRWEAKQKEND